MAWTQESSFCASPTPLNSSTDSEAGSAPIALKCHDTPLVPVPVTFLRRVRGEALLPRCSLQFGYVSFQLGYLCSPRPRASLQAAHRRRPGAILPRPAAQCARAR